jgi:hypothetical protein
VETGGNFKGKTMTFTTSQLEKMIEPHGGVFTYEANQNYDLRKGPVVGHVVRFSPTPKDIGDGRKSFGWTFPICAATDYVSEPVKVMAMIADALNSVPNLAKELIAARKRIADLESPTIRTQDGTPNNAI